MPDSLLSENKEIFKNQTISFAFKHLELFLSMKVYCKDMQAFYFIFFLTIVTFLTSCTTPIAYTSVMVQAESLMSTRPDSALTLLEGMTDSISNYPEETQMYWHLLTIQAKDKQYIVHTSDSLINSIVKFYEGYGDKAKLMMAYYYLGSVYRDMNDAPRALKAFQQTLDIDYPDYDLQVKAYSQMGTLFAYQKLYDEAIKVNRKFIDIYTKQGKAKKATYAWRDIARMYGSKNQPDSALYYYQNADQIALADKDTTRYHEILSELGGYYCRLGKNDSAKLILKYAEQQPSIRDKRHIHAMLGYVYKVENKLDSACHYYWKTLAYGDIRNAYHSYKNLYDAEVQRGNYRLATEYIDKALTLKDSIDQITQTEAVAKINSLYNYQHMEAENARLQLEQEKQNTLIIVLTLAALGIAMGGVIFFFQQKAKRLEAEKIAEHLQKQAKEYYEKSKAAICDNQKIIKELEGQLQQANKERDLLKAKQLEIKQKQLQNRNEEIALKQEEAKLRIDTLRSTTIYKEFQQAAKNEKINLQNEQNIAKWEALKEAIDTVYPEFTEKLHLLCPSLSDKETKVCLLARIGISPSGASIILKRTRQAVTNMRSRIFQKICSFNKDFKDFDDFINSLS